MKLDKKMCVIAFFLLCCYRKKYKFMYKIRKHFKKDFVFKVCILEFFSKMMVIW